MKGKKRAIAKSVPTFLLPTFFDLLKKSTNEDIEAMMRAHCLLREVKELTTTKIRLNFATQEEAINW